MKYDVFISYSKKDVQIIDRIEKELLHHGITYFIDRNNINPGEDFAEVITKSLIESEIMLFVWSENSNQSRETANEVALAISFNKTIIPFKIGTFQADYKLAYRLVRFDYIEAPTYNEQKIVELGDKIAHQLGKSRTSNDTKPIVVEKQESKTGPVLDDECEIAYRDALALIKQFKVREAFDIIYPLAVIGYKDSFDRLVFFTDKGIAKLSSLCEEQIEHLHQDADKGILVAKYLYSRYLCSISDPNAFRYAQAAVDIGFEPAKLALAKCYDLGVGTTANSEMASQLMIEAKDSGDIAAELEYIRYVSLGFNFKRDKRRAVRMWKALVDKGVAAAMLHLADYYLETEHRDTEKSIHYADMAIKEGYMEGYRLKAHAYGFDKHMNSIDLEKYIDYLTKGAEHNEVGALYFLALAYYNGYGVQKNLKHAERWAKRAAALGDASSMYLLSQIYYDGGDGIAENKVEAWKWANIGAERNDLLCTTMLGTMCSEGFGMDDYTEKDCVQFFERAVFLGNTNAIIARIELYLIYSIGKFGYARNMKKAVEYIKPLAEEQNAVAALLYGKLLTDINSAYCNEIMGVKYLKIACDGNIAEAYYRLGRLYKIGFGVIKDVAKAQELIATAIDMGYKE